METATLIKVGQIYNTKHGYVRILDIVNSRRVTVQFIYAPCTIKTVTAGNLRNGLIGPNTERPRKEKAHSRTRIILGQGYLGAGPHRFTENGQMTACYRAWRKMLGDLTIYVTADQRWFNYQHFATWFYDQLNSYGPWRAASYKWTMTNRLLVPGAHSYTPQTCCVVPHQINALLSYDPDRIGLPTGVSRIGHRYTSSISVYGQPIRSLGTFDTVLDAQLAYWTAKIDAVRRTAEHFRQWMPAALADRLTRFDWPDVFEYYGEQARLRLPGQPSPHK